MNSVFKEFPLPPSNFTHARAHKQDVDFINKRNCGMKRTCTFDLRSKLSVNRHISVV